MQSFSWGARCVHHFYPGWLSFLPVLLFSTIIKTMPTKTPRPRFGLARKRTATNPNRSKLRTVSRASTSILTRLSRIKTRYSNFISRKSDSSSRLCVCCEDRRWKGKIEEEEEEIRDDLKLDSVRDRVLGKGVDGPHITDIEISSVSIANRAKGITPSVSLPS